LPRPTNHERLELSSRTIKFSYSCTKPTDHYDDCRNLAVMLKARLFVLGVLGTTSAGSQPIPSREYREAELAENVFVRSKVELASRSLQVFCSAWQGVCGTGASIELSLALIGSQGTP
jgi:hypothetical protein